MLLVYGSKHSLLPRICEVEAVGIGATSKLFRTPNLAMRSFKLAQSQRSVGRTFHRSCDKRPWLAGDPA